MGGKKIVSSCLLHINHQTLDDGGFLNVFLKTEAITQWAIRNSGV